MVAQRQVHTINTQRKKKINVEPCSHQTRSHRSGSSTDCVAPTSDQFVSGFHVSTVQSFVKGPTSGISMPNVFSSASISTPQKSYPTIRNPRPSVNTILLFPMPTRYQRSSPLQARDPLCAETSSQYLSTKVVLANFSAPSFYLQRTHRGCTGLARPHPSRPCAGCLLLRPERPTCSRCSILVTGLRCDPGPRKVASADWLKKSL